MFATASPAAALAPAAESSLRRALPLALCICGFAAGLFGLWAHFHAQELRHVGIDESIYTYTGWSWLNGHWPYLDTWDHKGPVVYLASMLRVWLAGTGADALTISELLLGAAMAALTSAAAFLLWGPVSAGMAFALGVLLWAQYRPETGHFGTPGGLIALFSIAAVLCGCIAARNKRPAVCAAAAFLAGICGGLAFCTKPNAVSGYLTALACMALSPQPWRQRVRLMLLSLCAVLAPVAAFALVFYRAGSLNALADSYFRFNSIKGARMLAAAGIPRLAFRALETMREMGLLVPALVVAAAAALAWLRSRRDAAALVVLNWFAMACVVFASNGAYPYHTPSLIPPLALAGAWMVPAIFQARMRLSGIAAALAAMILILPPLTRAARSTPNHTDIGPRSRGWNRAVERITGATNPADTIYSLSPDGISLYNVTLRRNPSRYPTLVALTTRGYASESRWQELLRAFESQPPKFIYLRRAAGDDSTGVARLATQALWELGYAFPDEVDKTEYPSAHGFLKFIEQRYRLDFLEGRSCLLHLEAE